MFWLWVYKDWGWRLVRDGPFLSIKCLTSWTAKNICLAGVKSVTIFDPDPVTIEDLSSQVRFLSMKETTCNWISRSSFCVLRTSESRELKLPCPALQSWIRMCLCKTLEANQKMRLLSILSRDFMYVLKTTILHHLYQFPQVVVLTGVSLKKQLEINDWTHDNGVQFIAAETRGLFGWAQFCRFLPL